jgi:hypothetical protein
MGFQGTPSFLYYYHMLYRKKILFTHITFPSEILTALPEEEFEVLHQLSVQLFLLQPFRRLLTLSRWANSVGIMILTTISGKLCFTTDIRKRGNLVVSRTEQARQP